MPMSMDPPKNSRIPCSDPVYAVCVAMAEILVPDICSVIMEMVEQFHVDLGLDKWKYRMHYINKEYETSWKWSTRFLSCQIQIEYIECPVRNYRDLTMPSTNWKRNFGRYAGRVNQIIRKTNLLGVVCFSFMWGQCPLPENYVHAKLYNEEVDGKDDKRDIDLHQDD
jgi:hypothetical protein